MPWRVFWRPAGACGRERSARAPLPRSALRAHLAAARSARLRVLARSASRSACAPRGCAPARRARERWRARRGAPSGGTSSTTAAAERARRHSSATGSAAARARRLGLRAASGSAALRLGSHGLLGHRVLSDRLGSATDSSGATGPSASIVLCGLALLRPLFPRRPSSALPAVLRPELALARDGQRARERALGRASPAVLSSSPVAF
jgi:hypothetical protein